MDRFPRLELESMAGYDDLLFAPADQMHLDTSFLLVEKGFVLESIKS